MRKLFFSLLTFSFASLISCSDGDIINVELDFDDEFSACEGVQDIVLYNTKNDPSESLSVIISNYTIDEFLAVGDDNTFTVTKSGTLNYRTYSNSQLPSNLFCNDIPPSDINIVNDYSSSCQAVINTSLTEDDNDGVPAALENMDPNGDGNYDDAQDTDGDGLPDYLDADDDGDNVLTKDEDLDDDGDFTNDDTDGDTIPNYLDNDDDGDGINTRDEENDSQDQNPTNDITNSDVGADYLNKDVATSVTATAYRVHTISKTYLVTLTLTGIDIEILSQDELDFGKLADSEIPSSNKTRTITPEFN